MGTMSPILYDWYTKASHRPWEDATGPVRVSPHSWFVGQTWVGVILIDTGEGLIIIDSGIAGQMWQIFEAVRKLGYDPEKDIKLCLLSHCHIDHFSGMQHLQHYCHPKVYMSEIEKDWPANAAIHDTDGMDYYLPFEPDAYYDYEKTIELGRIKIQPVLTPGHTPGTTTFFFEDTDEQTGETYLVGLHGGLGLNTFGDDDFASAEEAFAARDAFRAMLLDMKSRKVDISITNHPMNVHFEEHRNPDPNNYRSFIDPAAWTQQFDDKLAELDELEKNSRYQRA